MITTYNRSESLQLCVDSIQALELKIPFEIIVSDDASADIHKKKMVQLNGLKLLLVNQNQGLAHSINRAIAASSGDFLVYLQDDWFVKPIFKEHVREICEVLQTGKADMVRLTSNTNFKKTKPISKTIGYIPRFSLFNIPNYRWRYSDHPFMVHRSFFERFGNYLEGTSTVYGETEYSIRMLKLNPKIALVKPYLVKENHNSVSVRDENTKASKLNVYAKRKAFIQNLGWLRYEVEALFYSPKKRGLISYKNYRKHQ